MSSIKRIAFNVEFPPVDDDAIYDKTLLAAARNGGFHYRFFVEYGILMACMIAATVVIGIHYPVAIRFMLPYLAYTLMRIVGRALKFKSLLYHKLLLYVPFIFFTMFTALDYCIRPAAKHTSAIAQIGIFIILIAVVVIHTIGCLVSYMTVLGHQYSIDNKKETIRKAKDYQDITFTVLLFYAIAVNLPWFVINVPLLLANPSDVLGWTMFILGLIPVVIGVICLVEIVTRRFGRSKPVQKSDETLLDDFDNVV